MKARVTYLDGTTDVVERPTMGRAVLAAMRLAGDRGQIGLGTVVESETEDGTITRRWVYVGCGTPPGGACACDGACWERR